MAKPATTDVRRASSGQYVTDIQSNDGWSWSFDGTRRATCAGL